MLTLFVLVTVFLGVVGAAPAIRSEEAPARYLDDAITLLRENALDRGKVDWPVVETQARRMAGQARVTADTYTAIRYVIGALGNPHTALLTPDEARAGDASPIVLPTAKMVGRDIAILTVPGFSSPESAEARRYEEAGMAAVRAMNGGATCGWIVDLRYNGGGNMWPMITVLAPLLDDGTIGYFVSDDGRRTTWSLSAGRARLDGTDMAVEANPLRPRHPDTPVALLTSGVTASAAEAALIAFRGLHRARTFGRPTAGFATGNTPFPLSDGAVLLVTEVRDQDRAGTLYGNAPIPPDQALAEDATPAETVAAAQAWLHAQPGCRAS